MKAKPSPIHEPVVVDSKTLSATLNAALAVIRKPTEQRQGLFEELRTQRQSLHAYRTNAPDPHPGWPGQRGGMIVNGQCPP